MVWNGYFLYLQFLPYQELKTKISLFIRSKFWSRRLDWYWIGQIKCELFYLNKNSHGRLSNVQCTPYFKYWQHDVVFLKHMR